MVSGKRMKMAVGGALVLVLAGAAAMLAGCNSARSNMGGGEGGGKNASQSSGRKDTTQLYEIKAMTPAHADSPYKRWANGPSQSKEFFPLAIYGQKPELAPRYQAVGINVYCGLWEGPTEAQLATLKKYNMPVICSQNPVGLAHINDPLIIGWSQGDEPDMVRDKKKFEQYISHYALPFMFGKPNAWESLLAAWPGQTFPAAEKAVAPIPPAWIVSSYNDMRAKDPSRPVFLNFMPTVATKSQNARGFRSGHNEDYLEYLKGCDIASFDIYPVSETGLKTGMSKEVAGKLWYVAEGVTNLRTWTNGQKPIWNAIEVTNIDVDNTQKLRPRDVKAQVWMSLVHGSMGIAYFTHQFKQGKYVTDRAVLDDPEMLAGLTAINRQILTLAPALNSPSSATPATVVPANAEVPIASMTKAEGKTIHVFAVAMRPGETKATFTVPGLTTGTVTVLGEDRNIPLAGGRFEDAFSDWDVHLYEIKP